MRPFKFIHMADTHLGNVQYNSFERFRDFNRAFKAVLEKALEEEVDFILHAGDFFNSNRINPETLSACYIIIRDFELQAQEQLERTIPIIVIEGNHDKRNYFAKRSWLRFLADLDLITLLSINFQETKETGIFKPYSSVKKKGNVISIGDAKIYGIPNYGAITEELIPKIYNSLPKDNSTFNILMMHFGISGQVKGKLGVEMSPELESLHEKIDYLALGHYHKNYALPEESPWIYNPGSTEINAFKELYGDLGNPYSRGVYLVEVSGKEPHNQKITLLEFENGTTEDGSKLPNRRFYNTKIDIEGIELAKFEDLVDYVKIQLKKRGFEELGDNTREELNFQNLDLPFIYLSIFGSVTFSKLDINFNRLRDMILNTFKVFDVRIFTQGLTSELDEISVSEVEKRTIEDIETEIFGKMVSLSPDYQIYTDQIVKLMLDLKIPLLSQKTGTSIMQMIEMWWNNTFPKKKTALGEGKSRKTLADFVPSQKIIKNQVENQLKGKKKKKSVKKQHSLTEHLFAADEENLEEDDELDNQIEEQLDTDLNTLLKKKRGQEND